MPEESCKSFAAAENEFCYLLSLSWGQGLNELLSGLSFMTTALRDHRGLYPNVLYSSMTGVGGRDMEWPGLMPHWPVLTLHIGTNFPLCTSHRDYRRLYVYMFSILVFLMASS